MNCLLEPSLESKDRAKGGLQNAKAETVMSLHFNVFQQEAEKGGIYFKWKDPNQHKDLLFFQSY